MDPSVELLPNTSITRCTSPPHEGSDEIPEQDLCTTPDVSASDECCHNNDVDLSKSKRNVSDGQTLPMANGGSSPNESNDHSNTTATSGIVNSEPVQVKHEEVNTNNECHDSVGLSSTKRTERDRDAQQRKTQDAPKVGIPGYTNHMLQDMSKNQFQSKSRTSDASNVVKTTGDNHGCKQDSDSWEKQDGPLKYSSLASRNKAQIKLTSNRFDSDANKMPIKPFSEAKYELTNQRFQDGKDYNGTDVSMQKKRHPKDLNDPKIIEGNDLPLNNKLGDKIQNEKAPSDLVQAKPYDTAPSHHLHQGSDTANNVYPDNQNADIIDGKPNQNSNLDSDKTPPCLDRFYCDAVTELNSARPHEAASPRKKHATYGEDQKEKWNEPCKYCRVVHMEERYPCLKTPQEATIAVRSPDPLQFRDELGKAENKAFILKDGAGININDISFLGRVGGGGFGEIFKCISHGFVFACKAVSRDKFHPEEAMAHFISAGRFAPALYAVVVKFNHIFLLMEYMYSLGTDGVDLAPEELAYRIFKAMDKYQRENLKHCDIKHQHIAFSRNGVKDVKFLDWGSVWYTKEEWICRGFTKSYLSIEGANRNIPPITGDEYAVAIVILRHVCKMTPLTKMGFKNTDPCVMDLISSGDMNIAVVSCITQALQTRILSPEMAHLLYALVTTNPSERLTANSALKLDVFKDFRKGEQPEFNEVHHSLSSGYISASRQDRVEVTLMIRGIHGRENTAFGTFQKSIPLLRVLTELLKPIQVTDFRFFEYSRGKKTEITDTKLSGLLENERLIYCISKTHLAKRTRNSSCGDLK